MLLPTALLRRGQRFSYGHHLVQGQGVAEDGENVFTLFPQEHVDWSILSLAANGGQIRLVQPYPGAAAELLQNS
ncbi:MAG: hypothetical protein KJ063_23680 [Anaerolineae bacterium]|nr:hypothetical protein [Anaerolineae bacterium]